MKRTVYKTNKFEKRKKNIIEQSELYYEALSDTEKMFQEGRLEKIRYYSVKIIELSNIAELEFIKGNSEKAKECINCLLNEFMNAVALLNEKENKRVDIININKKLKSGYLGYYALLLSKHEIIPVVTGKESDIYKLSIGELPEAEQDNPLIIMQRAIILKDSEMFENALEKRIKDIRKISVDSYLCADIYSMGLIKEAKRIGLEFFADYAEVDYDM